MSMIPFEMFPRSMLDMNTWFRPTLETFDPFDELDYMLGRNLQWLTKPSFLETFAPRFPRKYRVTVDVSGFSPSSIKTNVHQNKLIVSAKEESKEKGEDFTYKEFKRTYELPKNAETDKLASFVTGLGQLVVEVPLKEEGRREEDLFPKIVDRKEGGKMVSMDCSIPQNIDPSKVSVTCKDRDLIIKAEDVQEKPDSYSRMHYYKRCTMPENTDFNQLKCHYDKNKLSIEAPINPALQTTRQFPIEFQQKSIA